jgi:subtilisin family serine protease
MKALLVVAAALFLAGAPPPATAAEVRLYERGTLTLAALQDPATGRYRVPAGDWSGFSAWMQRNEPPKGPVMAVLDSGVMLHHPYIRAVLREALDLTGEGPEDAVGHGTTVALIAVRAIPAPLVSIRIVGLAPRDDGDALMARGLRLAAERGATIINVSAGVDLECANARNPNPLPFLARCDETPICRAVSEVRAQGALVVAAVGNTPGRTGCPACCRDALAVGATGPDGRPAPYSGAFPDILAPGTIQFQ